VFFPRGKYRTTRFTVPGGVSLVGEGLNASYLINISTDGFVFVTFTGSRSYCQGLTIDGQRANQPLTGSPPTPAGLAAVQFSRPNNFTAGSLNISGGVMLTLATTANGATIAINNASPGGEDILPGDIITLVEGANYEMVRVAPSYTPGNLTIPVVGSTAIAFTTAALVSVASSDVGISDCRVFSNGRDGIAFWHTIYGYADRNQVFDSSDTSIDLPSAGSRYVRVRGNFIESNGQWGVCFDTADAPNWPFGRVADCSSEGNTIRFVLGGVASPGGPTDGVQFGNVDRCRSVGDTIDLSRAGLSGVAYKGDSTHCHTIDVTVLGNATPRAGTSGIRQTIWTTDLKLRVRGGRISGVANGIDLGQTRRAHISDIDISNITGGYAITVLGDPANVQLVTIVGVEADGNSVGIRFGGTPMAGHKVSSTGCSLTGSTYAAVDAVGWTHVQTGNVP
jgi:hypothetical protein